MCPSKTIYSVYDFYFLLDFMVVMTKRNDHISHNMKHIAKKRLKILSSNLEDVLLLILNFINNLQNLLVI